MTRDVCLSAAIAFGIVASLAPLPAAGASVAQDARKICLERYELEKSGGTVPGGMTKSKYVSQCTNSIKRHAALESAQARTASARNAGTQGRK